MKIQEKTKQIFFIFLIGISIFSSFNIVNATSADIGGGMGIQLTVTNEPPEENPPEETQPETQQEEEKSDSKKKKKSYNNYYEEINSIEQIKTKPQTNQETIKLNSPQKQAEGTKMQTFLLINSSVLLLFILMLILTSKIYKP